MTTAICIIAQNGCHLTVFDSDIVSQSLARAQVKPLTKDKEPLFIFLYKKTAPIEMEYKLKEECQH